MKWTPEIEKKIKHFWYGKREREKEGGRQIEKIYYESLEKIPSELAK